MNWHSVKPEHADLVVRLQQEAKDAPNSYNRRLYRLAMLGYGVPGIILLLMFLTISGVISIAIISQSADMFSFAIIATLTLFFTAILIIRSMWTRSPPPEGIELTRHAAPELFLFLDKLQDHAKGQNLYKILIDDRMNISIVQHARFGIFGGHRNYMVLGLPLMMSLNKAQCKAIIAHEFGHIAGDTGAADNGQFSTWIYSLRKTWGNITNTLFNEHKWGDFFIKKFFAWYIPYFNAYSFPLIRKQEFAADKFATKIVSSNTLGQALIASGIHNTDLENIYWETLWNHAYTERTPPYMPFIGMTDFFRRSNRDIWQWQMALDQMITHTPGLQNTHPTLAERLATMNVDAKLPSQVRTSAAEELLPSCWQKLAHQLDENWWQKNQKHWEQRFEDAKRGRRTLTMLKSLYDKRAHVMTQDALWEYASLTDWLEGPEKAIPIFRKLLEIYPNFTRGYVVLGSILIDLDQPEGIHLLEKAMQMDANYTSIVCRKIYPWLMAHEKYESANKFRKAAIQRHELEMKARQERSILRQSDILLGADELTDDVLLGLAHQLKNIKPTGKKILNAYIARKKVHFLAKDWPFYVLGIQLKSHYRVFGLEYDAHSQLAKHIQLPGDGAIILLYSTSKEIHEKFKALPQSAIIRNGRICTVKS